MKIKAILPSVFFPERCPVCGRIRPFLKSYCPECGIDTNSISPDACPKCCHKNCICNEVNNIELPHFTSVYYYRGQLKRSILRFKFNSESSFADIFGKAMAERIKTVYGDRVFDGICFVPMIKSKERIRGYNQSKLLALKISKELEIPLVECLAKENASADQKSLSAAERIENLKGGFSVTKNIEGKVLILCDDIKTTGATLKECSDTLLSAGAEDVYCLSLAVTTYRKRTDIFSQ